MIPTLIIFTPFVAALLLWLLPIPADWSGQLATFAGSITGAFWISGWLTGATLSDPTTWLSGFHFDDPALQLRADQPWIKDIDFSYAVGYHGFQWWLTGLTILVGTVAIAYGAWVGRERPRAYYPLMLMLMGSLVGVFAAQDLLLFYIFFELMLIPIYVLVGVWGGPNRVRATVTFVIYTMVGSLLMLASIVALGISQGTFSLAALGTSDNDLIFLGFVAAFAVKAPLLPFHGWLRAAYTEAPIEVAALLSGVVSKAAVVGLVWIVLPHFPEPVDNWREVILFLAAATLVYGSALAFRQPDARGIIAYSSMGQMGLIVLGIFATNDLGLDGAILQSVNHGLVSASLFLLVGMIEARTGTGVLTRLGGMAKGRPILATLVMVVGMFTLAVPGSTNFAGEFAILSGVFFRGWGYAAVGAVAIMLGALYALRLISAVLHERKGESVASEQGDLVGGELTLVLPLVAVLVALSVWPAAISERSFPNDEPTVTVTGETG
ncbi:MAG: NADH-quinone oxidoreductase subunit M [Gaiellales bacterium]